MKILEVSPFSDGFCGVWSRVEKEAELLEKKGHEVYIFSSNIKRGKGKIEYASEFEKKGPLKIYRFKPKTNFGENTYFWNFEKKALEIKPDLIITHAYRQYYSTIALKIAKKLKIPCILVTHAPFLEKKLRNWKLNLMVWVYDNFVGRRILNKYFKIFTITKWEKPYLLKLGTKKEKIIYIPNGVPEEFFKLKIPKKKSEQNQILFLGRIAPIKDIELLVKAFALCLKKNKELVLTLVGPEEEEYGKKVRSLIAHLKLEKNVNLIGPVFDLKEKIDLIDKCDVYVLPSKREAMPQTLIEVMSREKVAISSNTEGGKEIVTDGKTGYLFEIGNEKELCDKILQGLEESKLNKEIRKNARDFVKQFSWEVLVNKIDGVIKQAQ